MDGPSKARIENKGWGYTFFHNLIPLFVYLISLLLLILLSPFPLPPPLPPLFDPSDGNSRLEMLG